MRKCGERKPSTVMGKKCLPIVTVTLTVHGLTVRKGEATWSRAPVRIREDLAAVLLHDLSDEGEAEPVDSSSLSAVAGDA